LVEERLGPVEVDLLFLDLGLELCDLPLIIVDFKPQLFVLLSQLLKLLVLMFELFFLFFFHSLQS
jgi:hypothetical protein